MGNDSIHIWESILLAIGRLTSVSICVGDRDLLGIILTVMQSGLSSLLCASLAMRAMCWDCDIEHRNDDIWLVDADYFSCLNADLCLCFGPLLKDYLQRAIEICCGHPVLKTLQSQNMPGFRRIQINKDLPVAG